MSIEAVRKDSLYEYLSPPQKIMSQHFVDLFDGDILNERWALTILRGTGIGFMQDDINEGFNIRAIGTPTPQFKTKISFSSTRQYSNVGSTMIGEWRTLELTNNPAKMALVNISSDAANTNFISTIFSATFFALQTAAGGAPTTTFGSTTYNDLLFHRHELTITSTMGTLIVAGNLEATSTTTLPTLRLEPTFQQNSQTANVAKNMRVRFAEAFNH